MRSRKPVGSRARSLAQAVTADHAGQTGGEREQRPGGTGMPESIWLMKFGVIVEDYFGHTAYHVGSSLRTKDYRDVDVRLILPDDEFVARFGHLHASFAEPKLAAITLAFTALGREMTGLPIDFQIQPMTLANERHSGWRSALIEVRRD